MKKIIQILLTLFLSLILSSCYEKENSKIGVTFNSPETSSKSNKISYDKTKEELTVGTVKIKPSISNDFPRDLTIYKGVKTYINSNVNNYIYFILDTENIPDVVGKYYIDLLEKLGYVRVFDEYLTKEEKKEQLYDSLEYVLKNKYYLPIENRTEEKLSELEKLGKLDTINNEYNSKVRIYIKSNTPENIQKGLGLNGTFVEIYYE